MFRDFELERLDAVKEIAYEEKIGFQQKLDEEEKKYSLMKTELSKSSIFRHRAYTNQELARRKHYDINVVNNARIKKLDSKQEKEFFKMRKAYTDAEQYYSKRNGASASIHSGKAERHKRKSKSFSAERRQLVDEIISVNDSFALSRAAFEQSKIDYREVKIKYDVAKTNYDLAKQNFLNSKKYFNDSSEACKEYFQKSISRQKLNPEEEYELANQVGVPRQYLDSMAVRYLISGEIDFFFGGIGDPIGPGHGHYVVNRDGTVKYRRDPLDYHLSKKFLHGDVNLFNSSIL